MAFLNKKWLKVLNSVKDNIKAVAIMGGVRDYEKPVTMSAMKNILNRFGYATMNQLYHPKNTKKFFHFLNKNENIKRYIVTNNLVNELFPKPNNENKNNQINKVINLNNNNEYLKQITELLYKSIFGVQPQPFDYFTALIINNLLFNNTLKEKINKYNIVYNNKYALTIVSKDNNLNTIKQNIKTEIENIKYKPKKNSFTNELKILNKLSEENFITITDIIEPEFKEITQFSII